MGFLGIVCMICLVSAAELPNVDFADQAWVVSSCSVLQLGSLPQ
jgi:hypothetical protein